MSHRKRWRPSKYAVAYRCNWLRCRRLMQALRDVGRRQLSALALTESDVSNILSTRKLEGELLVGVKRRAKTSQAAAPAAVVNLVNTVILTICCQQTQHTLCSVSIWVALAEYVTNIVLQYRSHDTFFSVFMFLAALMLAASGAYCMGLGDWLSACVLSNLFFPNRYFYSSFLILTKLGTRLMCRYAQNCGADLRSFDLKILGECSNLDCLWNSSSAAI